MEKTSLKGFIFDKVPPSDKELENKILSALINEPDYYIKVSQFFSPEIFYHPTQKVVAQAIYDLNQENKPIDLITVTKKVLSLSKDIKPYDVTVISNSATLFYNTETWFLILIEYYIRRRILTICKQYQIKATDMSEDALVMVSQLAEQISDISNISIYNTSLNPQQAVEKLLNHVQSKHEAIEKFRSIGNAKLDEYIYLDSGDIIMIGGTGGSGKSKLAMFMAKNLLLKYKDVAVQIFAFEDPSNAILKSWLTYDCMLTSREIDSKGYELSKNNLNDIERYSKLLTTLDFKIINSPCFINDIKTSFLNFCRERPNKFNLLIIDNVMLLKDNQKKVLSKDSTSVDDMIASTISEISKETMQYNAAIMFLHHFTKEASNPNKIRTGFQPESIDVRGSSRFNDIALTTLLINKPSKHKELLSLYPGYKDMLEDLMIVDVTKSRNGKEGSVRLFVDLGYNIFITANDNVKPKKKK